MNHYRLKIHQDTDAGSPRDWDNLGTMVCWHQRYNLGDEQPRQDPGDYLRDLVCRHVGADSRYVPDQHIERILEKYFVLLPLYLYDHGGLSMNVGGFHCPWDSGQVGYIHCLKGTEGLTDEQIELILKTEVLQYDSFLRGECYWFELVEVETCSACCCELEETSDTIGGFIGNDIDELIKEALTHFGMTDREDEVEVIEEIQYS